jgi:uncharacterized protein YndB with AHSA1/START domain
MDPAATPLGRVIDRRIPGTPALVFQALVDPALYARWMGPSGSEMQVDEMDVRPGGRLRFRVRFPGGPEFALGGTYREVDPPRRLVHTWAMVGDEAETTVTFDLSEELGQTRLLLTHVGFADRDDMGQNDAGWRHQLDRLETLITSLDADVVQVPKDDRAAERRG